jgi:hypothetical protein
VIEAVERPVDGVREERRCAPVPDQAGEPRTAQAAAATTTVVWIAT